MELFSFRYILQRKKNPPTDGKIFLRNLLRQKKYFQHKIVSDSSILGTLVLLQLQTDLHYPSSIEIRAAGTFALSHLIAQ